MVQLSNMLLVAAEVVVESVVVLPLITIGIRLELVLVAPLPLISMIQFLKELLVPFITCTTQASLLPVERMVMFLKRIYEEPLILTT